MAEMESWATLVEIVSTGGITILALMAYISERRLHEATRAQYRADLREKEKELTDVLKDVAGIRSNMTWVQGMTHRQRESDTRPLRLKEDDE